MKNISKTRTKYKITDNLYKSSVFSCFLCGAKVSQFTAFPSPTPNLVKRTEYIENDKFEEKSNVLSCFLCADYVSVFTVILHHA